MVETALELVAPEPDRSKAKAGGEADNESQTANDEKVNDAGDGKTMLLGLESGYVKKPLFCNGDMLEDLVTQLHNAQYAGDF